MQILNILLDRRYLVLFLFVVCVVFEPSFPSNILAPFQTPTPDMLAPSKQITSNTLPFIEQWRWSGDADFSQKVAKMNMELKMEAEKMAMAEKALMDFYA